jgi:hypothetical protein
MHHFLNHILSTIYCCKFNGFTIEFVDSYGSTNSLKNFMVNSLIHYMAMVKTWLRE